MQKPLLCLCPKGLFEELKISLLAYGVVLEVPYVFDVFFLSVK